MLVQHLRRVDDEDRHGHRRPQHVLQLDAGHHRREQLARLVAVIGNHVERAPRRRLDLAGTRVFDDAGRPAIGNLAIVAGSPVPPTDRNRELEEQREDPSDPRQFGIGDWHSGPIKYRAADHFARLVVETRPSPASPSASRGSANLPGNGWRRRRPCGARPPK